MTTGETTCTQPATHKIAINRENSLNSLASEIAFVNIQTTQADLMDLRERLAFMLGRIKAMQISLDSRLLSWIEANGPITIGTREIYIGTDKTTKVRDLRAALVALLECSGGDWEVFALCLSANAIKHGAARGVLGDAWEKHFEVTVKKGVDEKPVKVIADVDTKFLPAKRSK